MFKPCTEAGMNTSNTRYFGYVWTDSVDHNQPQLFREEKHRKSDNPFYSMFKLNSFQLS